MQNGRQQQRKLLKGPNDKAHRAAAANRRRRDSRRCQHRLLGDVRQLLRARQHRVADGGSEVVVDSPDFSLLKTTFGSESDLAGGVAQPAYNPAMDATLDGVLDATDFSKFKTNFGADAGPTH
jgi:hypothetical protein